ncbi:unnamed protein product [Lepeophtheirus salmonis]|uniref:(salmon louse) hypothetical protein n=1 Tax=Lepeophtheirus salmonis TaxID=72036 RepID=A0A7R8CP50_LEPSM|nr:unnamed protein product [Lepeophtheirus salmonis]CAF2882178.1 unnamed protein product [Lepeophtheirus salmonis]
MTSTGEWVLRRVGVKEPEFTLQDHVSQVSLGRGEGNSKQCLSVFVSRQHALLNKVLGDDGLPYWKLKHISRTTYTYVNGIELNLDAEIRLNDKDLISLGENFSSEQCEGQKSRFLFRILAPTLWNSVNEDVDPIDATQNILESDTPPRVRSPIMKIEPGQLILSETTSNTSSNTTAPLLKSISLCSDIKKEKYFQSIDAHSTNLSNTTDETRCRSEIIPSETKMVEEHEGMFSQVEEVIILDDSEENDFLSNTFSNNHHDKEVKIKAEPNRFEEDIEEGEEDDDIQIILPPEKEIDIIDLDETELELDDSQKNLYHRIALKIKTEVESPIKRDIEEDPAYNNKNSDDNDSDDDIIFLGENENPFESAEARLLEKSKNEKTKSPCRSEEPQEPLETNAPQKSNNFVALNPIILKKRGGLSRSKSKQPNKTSEDNIKKSSPLSIKKVDKSLMKAKRSEKLKQIADKESNILKKRLKNKFATAQVSTTSSASKSEKSDLEHCSSLVVDDQSKNNLKRSNSEASSSSVQSKKSKPSSIDENSIPSSETNNVSFKVPEIPIVSKKLRVHAETVSDHDGRKRIAKLKFANMITNTSSQDVAKTLVSTLKVLSYPSISEKPPRKVRWSSQLITIREIPSIGKSLKVNQKKDCPNPISTSRLDPPKPPVQNDFTMDEILTHILSWNTSWLEEQTRVKVSPRVDLNRYKMTHVPPVFDNYKDYCHIFFPLMFHELWLTVYRDYLRQKENPIRQVTEILDVRMCREVSSFSARSLLTSHDRFDSHYIPRGALIKINFFKKFCSSICDNLLKCYPSSIRDQLTFINDYSVIVLPNVLVNIKKFLQTKLPVVELISIINPSLRLFSAVIDAKKSPLFPSLLRHEDSSSVKAISSSQAYDAPHLNKLNPIQRKIVIDTAETCILSPKPSAFLSLIQGPPGLISKEKKKPPKILLVAPSNSAIDSLVKKLRRLAPEMKLIRVGQLNSMDKQVKEIELTRIVNNKLNEMESQLGTNESIQREITHRQEEINHIGHEIEKAISSSKINLLQRKLKDETFKLKRAKKSIQTLSNYEKDKKRQEITRTTLDDADIVATTLSSSLNGQMTSHFLRDKYKPGRNFSICIVDEASQCVEPEGLIPLKLGFSKLVMVGDPEQLPATVSSIKAKDLSYGQSLFNRLFKSSRNSDTNTSIHCLKIQYRMHGDIARWPNHYFYGGELTNGVSWTSRNSDLFPLKLFDLSWTKMEETNNEKSIFNTKEAKFVATLISEIKKEPHIIPGNKTIGVITFYSQQRKHLSLELQNLGIETSDGKRISKSSKQNDIHTSSSIGFTGESERLNVALTRAKYALYIVGDFQTLSKSLMWSDLLKDVRKRKCIVNIERGYLDLNTQIYLACYHEYPHKLYLDDPPTTEG